MWGGSSSRGTGEPCLGDTGELSDSQDLHLKSIDHEFGTLTTVPAIGNYHVHSDGVAKMVCFP